MQMQRRQNIFQPNTTVEFSSHEPLTIIPSPLMNTCKYTKVYLRFILFCSFKISLTLSEFKLNPECLCLKIYDRQG